MKKIGLIIVCLSGALLLYATQDFPRWGDPNSPASTHVSPRYIQKSLEETDVPNLVTSILADYRGYDTMFETTVIFAAGLSCFILLRAFKKKEDDLYYRHISTGITLHIKGDKTIPASSKEFERIDTMWTPYDLIIKTVCRFLVPFIQIFALYVLAHGHESPGGGFQGGVIFGASFIVIAIAFDLRTALIRFKEKMDGLLSALGVFIYAGLGALCLLLGGNFLNYKELATILPMDPVEARAYGILGVEIGVFIAVMAVMLSIYVNIVSEGRHDEGL
ncbi:MAG: hydrogen gas-evolving membrane-bound hydrogenase subunit E [Desulfatiglandaceae bacterium]